jgi:penicillin-binding protein 2
LAAFAFLRDESAAHQEKRHMNERTYIRTLIGLGCALALLVFSPDPALARAPRPAPKKSVAKVKSAAARTSSKTKYAAKSARRASGRATRLAAARAAARRAEIARIHAIDANLLRTAQNGLQLDDVRGEDPNVRRIALDALGDRAGTVVVMDASNGRVLSMVNQRWAVGKSFKPCSTIKMLTSLAALSEKLVDPDAPMDLGGYEMTMRTALAKSNNEYFQRLGRKLGFNRVVQYAKKFGFGQRTGVNLPGESPGSIPFNEPDDMGRTCSHGDGFGVTALQLAAFTGALANGGVFYRPQILRTKQEIANFKPVVARTVAIAESDRQKIIEGMLAAVSFGTARKSNAAALRVAGKTGSCLCDDAPRTRVGLFTSFVNAPGKSNLVISVITIGSTQRGSIASIIAGDIYNDTAPNAPDGAASAATDDIKSIAPSLRNGAQPDAARPRRVAPPPDDMTTDDDDDEGGD